MNEEQTSPGTGVRLIEVPLLEPAFAEWDRRYREDPERFMSDVEHLLGHTPSSYAELASAYLVALIDELEDMVHPPAPPSS